MARVGKYTGYTTMQGQRKCKEKSKYDFCKEKQPHCTFIPYVASLKTWESHLLDCVHHNVSNVS